MVKINYFNRYNWFGMQYKCVHTLLWYCFYIYIYIYITIFTCIYYYSCTCKLLPFDWNFMINVYVSMCMRVCMSLCVCMCVCVCVNWTICNSNIWIATQFHSGNKCNTLIWILPYLIVLKPVAIFTASQAQKGESCLPIAVFKLDSFPNKTVDISLFSTILFLPIVLHMIQ